MLEQGEQTGRRKPVLDRAGEQQQEGCRRRRGQRDAGRIVDGHAPALHFGSDPPAEVAVRRDQRRGLARRIEGPAEGQRDNPRLLARIAADDAAEVGAERGGQRIAVERPARPGLRRSGRPQGLGDQADARGRRFAQGGAVRRGRLRPVLYVLPPDAETLQQPREAELRMAFVGLDRRPAFLVEMAVQSRQDDLAVRQRRDRRQQVRRRRDAAGRAGGDHRMVRRGLRPAPLQPFQQQIAPRRRVHRAVLFQDGGPVRGHDLQEFEDLLPVRG